MPWDYISYMNNKTLKIFRSDSVSTRLIDGGAKLYCADRSCEQFINNTGLAIWRLLDGSNTTEDIVQKISDEFQVSSSEEVRDDVQKFISELVDNKWVSENQDKLLYDSEFFVADSEAPSSIDISVTGKCNLKCPFCFYSESMRDRCDLPLSEWKLFFNELASLGVREVTISGGEILTRKDLFEIIDSIIDNRMRYALLSNATLLTSKHIKKLIEPDRLKRLNYFQVSVDGSGPEIHDRIRGNGSFVKTDRALRLLKQTNIPLTVRVTVNKHNLYDLEKIFSYLLEDINIKRVSTNAVVAMGEAENNSVALSAKERAYAIEKLHLLSAERWPNRIIARAGPLYEYELFKSFENGESLNSAYKGKLTACGCTYKKLSVHHDGVITPCNMLPSFEIGRINKDKIIDIWANSRVLKQLRMRKNILLKDIEFCSECEFNTICNGGCPGTEAERSGSLISPNKESCYRLFKQNLENKK